MEIYKQIAKIGKQYGATKIVLFGSRARGDNREDSDVDIAVYGVPKEQQGSFWSAIDDMPTILDFDIIHVTRSTNAALLKNIEKDGVVLMDKVNEKYNKLKNAYEQLKKAIVVYEQTQLDEVRDGAIQRFEFCTELAWKTLRERLIEEGYTDLNSPKAVLRQAYSSKLLENGDMWIDLLNDRNRTSHIYDEETAEEIFMHIQKLYAHMFVTLIEKLKQ